MKEEYKMNKERIAETIDKLNIEVESINSFDDLQIYLKKSLDPIQDTLYDYRLSVESYMMEAHIISLHSSLKFITIKLGHVELRPNNWESIALHRFKDTMKLALENLKRIS